MAYLDTSVVLAYYCPEPLSIKAENAIIAEQEPVISSLTLVEFVSALARKIREKGLTKRDANKILDQFNHHRSRGYYTEKIVEPFHYTTAFNFIYNFETPLRTLDSLHIAIALESGIPILTSDVQMAMACKKLRIPSVLIQ